MLEVCGQWLQHIHLHMHVKCTCLTEQKHKGQMTQQCSYSIPSTSLSTMQ